MSSVWANNPEYFDEWIEARALEGELGPELQAKAENGDVCGYELWDLLNKGEIADKDFFHRADLSYYERMMP